MLVVSERPKVRQTRIYDAASGRALRPGEGHEEEEECPDKFA